MIVLPIAMLMAAAGAGPVAPSHERAAFGQCLSKFVHDKLEAKMDLAAFKAAAEGGLRALRKQRSARPGPLIMSG